MLKALGETRIMLYANDYDVINGLSPFPGVLAYIAGVGLIFLVGWLWQRPSKKKPGVNLGTHEVVSETRTSASPELPKEETYKPPPPSKFDDLEIEDIRSLLDRGKLNKNELEVLKAKAIYDFMYGGRLKPLGTGEPLKTIQLQLRGKK